MRTTPEDVQAALTTIDKMKASGDLPEESYYKCVVTLAAECLVKHDDVERAMILLNRCPPEYYSEVIMVQMAEDDHYAQSVLELTFKIIQYGIVDVELHHPTMPPGEA